MTNVENIRHWANADGLSADAAASAPEPGGGLVVHFARPLTLRQLLWMAEGHGRDEWGRTALLCALIGNAHRDPKRSRAFKPSDFDPWTVDMPEGTIMIDRDNVGLLREAFGIKG